MCRFRVSYSLPLGLLVLVLLVTSHCPRLFSETEHERLFPLDLPAETGLGSQVLRWLRESGKAPPVRPKAPLPKKAAKQRRKEEKPDPQDQPDAKKPKEERK